MSAPVTEPSAEQPVLARQCTARANRTGQRCRRPPILGTTVCGSHGGRAPQVKAAAARRLAEQKAREHLGIARDVDPRVALLELVSEAAGNVEYLRVLVEQDKNTRAVYDDKGRPYTHPVLAFYNEERDRLARVAKMAADAGIDERSIRIAEGASWAKRAAEALDAAASRAGIEGDTRRALVAALAEELREREVGR